MQNLLLENANVVLADEKVENASLLIENGKISKITKAKINSENAIDLSNCTIYAGFIDIHNHGAVGVDVNEANADDLREVGKFLASKGVTVWLPAFVPDAGENYRKVVCAIDEVMETQTNEPIAQIVGVHYEGVFANEKMCGALRPEFFKTFKNGDEINQLPKLKRGVHLTTLAPEIENGIELIKELHKQNWIVSIGHTNADFQTLEAAYDAGAKQITHLFNAMTGVHHREIGVAGWALTKKDVSCEIIADGVHVAPQMLKFAANCKSAANLMLVSDSIAPTGLGDGEYEIWNDKISVVNNQTKNERGSIAGSVITMLDAVKMMSSLGFSATEISQMASGNQAKLLGIEKSHGSIEVGKRADLVILDELQNVKLTLIGGKINL
ncbi:MAG: N-acetylglucosamine-6-phosphate deacetylase [Acidobacteriota bacterium]